MYSSRHVTNTCACQEGAGGWGKGGGEGSQVKLATPKQLQSEGEIKHACDNDLCMLAQHLLSLQDCMQVVMN